LNVIKGKAMPLDLCAVTRGEELRWSFMSVAAGLMCDVDLGM
jgi:sphingosine kinase